MKIDYSKLNGLIPAIVQDARTDKVLMLGFMNEEALAKTTAEKKVTFYSRSKERLWTKGETSGNFLEVKEIIVDCDQDTVLIKANPTGPTCHTGTDTCFNETNTSNLGDNNSLEFLAELTAIIKERNNNRDASSYTSELFESGINRVAQKVGEEAVEVVIAAKDSDQKDFQEECADLLFHLLVLLEYKGSNLDKVIEVLKNRHQNN